MVVFQHEATTPFANGPDSEVWSFYIDMSTSDDPGRRGFSHR